MLVRCSSAPSTSKPRHAVKSSSLPIITSTYFAMLRLIRCAPSLPPWLFQSDARKLRSYATTVPYFFATSTLPYLERPRIAHAAESRIEAEHDFAERHAVPSRLGGGSDLQCGIWCVCHSERCSCRDLLAANRLDEPNRIADLGLDTGIVL